MSKSKVYVSDSLNNSPEWYWVNGLHDACIVGVETMEFPFDYNHYVGEKNKADRNLMVLNINADGALYDTTVTEIRLFNYKILTDHISLKGREKVWWLTDRVINHGNYYTMEIDLQDFDSDPEEFTFKIKFERAEVKRR